MKATQEKIRHSRLESGIQKIPQSFERIELLISMMDLLALNNLNEFGSLFSAKRDLEQIDNKLIFLKSIKNELDYIKKIIPIIIPTGEYDLFVIESIFTKIQVLYEIFMIYTNNTTDRKYNSNLKSYKIEDLEKLFNAYKNLIEPITVFKSEVRKLFDPLKSEMTERLNKPTSKENTSLAIKKNQDSSLSIDSSDSPSTSGYSYDTSIINHSAKSDFEKRFPHYYPALALLDKYQQVNWQEQYQLAIRAPDWPFPLNQDDFYPQPFKLEDEIDTKNSFLVFTFLKRGVAVKAHHLVMACELDVPSCILQALTSSLNLEKKEDQETLNIALHAACRLNNKPAVAILISKGADVNCKIQDLDLGLSIRPLHLAFQYGDETLVRMLTGQKASIELARESSLLYFLVCNKNEQNFKELASLDLFPEISIYRYVQDSFPEILEQFKALEKVLDQTCASPSTLSERDEIDKLVSLRWLIEQGVKAETLIWHQGKLIPLLHHVSCDRGTQDNSDCIRVLSLNGNIDAKDKEGYTALHYVIAKAPDLTKVKNTIFTLVKAGASVDTTNLNQQTLLHSFLQRADIHEFIQDTDLQEFYRGIVSRELDYSASDSQGVKLLNLVYQDFTALLILLSIKPKLYRDIGDLTDYNFNNVLHVFARCPYIEDEKQFQSIHAFIRNGVGINDINISGKSPLGIAVENGNYNAAWCLIANGATVDKKIFKSAPLKIQRLLSCFKAITQLIGLITKSYLMKTVFSALPMHYSVLKKAYDQSPILCKHLLLNYLQDILKVDDIALTNQQKLRLIDDINSSKLFRPEFYYDLVLLAMEGRFIQPTTHQIVRLLSEMIESCGRISYLDQSEKYKSMLLWAQNQLKKYHPEAVKQDNVQLP